MPDSLIAKEIRSALTRSGAYAFEEFVRNAEARGMIVHWARDADEACGIVEELARSHSAETIVKSKSMTTEEIGLNEFLESRGMQPLETDLGEWIIQIANERPSHIIVPAIHKTRDQIARLFAEHLDTDPSLDAAAMEKDGRCHRLRRQEHSLPAAFR